MTNPDEYYAVNTIPPIVWALNLYRKAGGQLKKKGVVKAVFPAGDHKEFMSKKGSHEILVWFSKMKVHVRAKCQYDKNCEFNSDRVEGNNRESMKNLPWDKVDSQEFIRILRKWLMKLDLDFVTFIRALNTICNRYVDLPLTSQYGKTFENFDAYRKIKWPEEATPDKRVKFLEELLVRVAFWFQTAAIVGALKVKS
jgi:hypothetical protein